MDTYSSHSSLLQKLVTAILLAMAFFISAGLMVYLSLRSKEVKVPDLIGKAEGDAEKLLGTEGLRLKVRNRTTDEKIQANFICEQIPNAGVTVKAGQVVNVTISTGIEARKNEADAKPTPTGTPKPKPKPKPSASPTGEPGKDAATPGDAGKVTKEEPGKGKDTTKIVNKAGGEAGKPSPSPANKGKSSPSPTTKASPKPSPKPPGTN